MNVWSVRDVEDMPSHCNYVVIGEGVEASVRLSPPVLSLPDEGWVDYAGEGATMRMIDLDEDMYAPLYAYWQAEISALNSYWWGFKLNGWQQPLRINEYKKGCSFPTHTDYGERDASKLAFVQLLSPDASFSGGELEIGNEVVKLSQGQAVVFPAYTPHSVRTVTRGVRYTLAGWATGSRFV